MSALVVPLETIGAADLPRVGGKAANLGELLRAGQHVPPGFCVSTTAFACFMAAAPGDVYEHLDQLTSGDIEQLRQAGAEVRSALADVALPAAVADAVVQAWRGLGADAAYAVRSSATAEDLPQASFAGQQDTYLNIRGEQALLASVKNCFISLFTDRAIMYRVQHGFDHRSVALAVVVQRTVEAEVAGILFTADPVTGKRNLVAIDAGFGLGEALVSGLVSADLYHVDKRARRVVSRQIATKRLAVRGLDGGGTQQVALDAHAGAQAALTDAQVLALAEIGSRIEAQFGSPQDIEWAIADGTISIMQARPITSLYPLPEPRPTDGALHVYGSFGHFQVMTDAMPPLTLSLWRVILPVGHGGGQLESTYMCMAGGRLYIDLSAILRHPLGRRILLRASHNADRQAARVLREVVQRPELSASLTPLAGLRQLPTALPLLGKIVYWLAWGRPEATTERVSQRIDAHLAAAQARLDATPDPRRQLAVAVDELRHIFETILFWAPAMAAGLLASPLLGTVLKHVIAAPDRSVLGRGLSGNVATEMNLAVGDLADVVRASPPLAAYLRHSALDAPTRLAGAAELPGGAAFLDAWQRFLHRYGSRGPSEIDLSRPRWAEDPASLLQMVVSALGHAEAGAHRAHYRQLMTANAEAAARIIAAARQGRWGWIRGPLVRRLVRVQHHLAPLREHHKFLLVRLLALIKPIIQDAGAQLQAMGGLEAADDVWFLSVPELLAAFDAPTPDLRPLVAERRAAFERYQQLTPPRVITSDGEIPIVKLVDVEAPDGALIGSPVSAGVVEGIARVVRDPGAETLQRGEILVAPFTDPGWTPLFVSAAGLVTEVGGLMTHGSVVAREYGIPAVVGVAEATTRIVTGQRVRVHGDAGYVELLDAGRSAEAA